MYNNLNLSFRDSFSLLVLLTVKSHVSFDLAHVLIIFRDEIDRQKREKVKNRLHQNRRQLSKAITFL